MGKRPWTGWHAANRHSCFSIGGDRIIAETRERYDGHVPIIVLSAVADSEEALQAGADAYIRKPYAIEQLVGTIQRLLAV